MRTRVDDVDEESGSRKGKGRKFKFAPAKHLAMSTDEKLSHKRGYEKNRGNAL